jgi:prevent-host-death family protein
MCYTVPVAEIASRALRNQLRSVLERVERGEEVTITVDGRPVASLHRVEMRPRWMPRTDFVRNVLSQQADPTLAKDLQALAPDTTDDLPL